MTKIIKNISLALFIYFIVFAILIIVSFISLDHGMNKYGGEMADGIGFIVLSIALVLCLIFLLWTFAIYKSSKTPMASYIHLGLIFLLGVIVPIYLITKTF